MKVKVLKAEGKGKKKGLFINKVIFNAPADLFYWKNRLFAFGRPLDTGSLDCPSLTVDENLFLSTEKLNFALEKFFVYKFIRALFNLLKDKAFLTFCSFGFNPFMYIDESHVKVARIVLLLRFWAIFQTKNIY